MRRAVLVLAAAGGCEEACDPDERVGIWSVTATEIAGGSCGELGSDTVEITDPNAVQFGCMATSPDFWSEDMCSLTRHYLCQEPNGSFTYEWSGTTERRSRDRFAGKVSLTIRDVQGIACTSDYFMEWTRL